MDSWFRAADSAAVCGALALSPAPASGVSSDETGDVFATLLPTPGGLFARGVTVDEYIQSMSGAPGAPGGGTADGAPGPPTGAAMHLGLPGPFASAGSALQVLTGMTFPQRAVDFDASSGSPPGPLSSPPANPGEVGVRQRAGIVLLSARDLASGAVHEGLSLLAVCKSALVVLVLMPHEPDPDEVRVGPRGRTVDDLSGGYGIRASRLEASADPLEVVGRLRDELRDARQGARQDARQGGGPVLVELCPGPDPLTLLGNRLLRMPGIGAAALAEVEDDARQAVARAIASSQGASP